jgi:hypothetical protein
MPPELKRKILIFLVLVFPLLMQAEDRKRIPYSRLATELFSHGAGELKYQNVDFYNDLPDEGKEYFLTDSYIPPKVHFIRGGFRKFLTSLGIRPDEKGWYNIQKEVNFQKCRFENDLRFTRCRFTGSLVFSDVEFPKASEDAVGIETNQGGALLLDSCELNGYFSFQTQTERRLFPRFRSTKFEHFFVVLGEALLRVNKCHFDLGNFWLQSHHDKSSVSIDSSEFISNSNKTVAGHVTELFIRDFSFRWNRIYNNNENPVTLYCPSSDVQLFNNEFDLNIQLILSTSYANNEPAISLASNKFKRRLMLGLESIGRSSVLDPDELNKLNFGINWLGYYEARGKDQLGNKSAFRSFQKTNKLLFDFFRTTGDLESANRMYVHIMDAEGRRLQYEYEINPGFQTWFRFRLNRLLHFYTQYGTDPARALLISVYVMLLFAFLYFFFPSDWDIESKSRLIRNFRDFVEKNEKGYLRPFLFLLYGLMVSSLNAVFLSLNAFTTLGFGDIPTRGLARYLCIFQGFLGWFLLSMFTVALFNQAQF